MCCERTWRPAEAQPPSARESRSKDGDYKVFYEDSYKRTPSSTQLEAFYRDVFSRGQMEIECIVTSLIYVERLLKAARGKIRLRAGNWRPVLLSCMIMASKVCDDLSMWNADFGHICAEFTLPRINALEAALLKAYGFNATVAASEYAKYYFHLRSMASRLQIESEVRPLDVKAATKLSERSSLLSSSKDAAPSKELARLKVRRAQSLGGATRRRAAPVGDARGGRLDEPLTLLLVARLLAFPSCLKRAGLGRGVPSWETTSACLLSTPGPRARACRRSAAGRARPARPRASSGRPRARRPRPPLPRAAPAEGPGSQKSTAKRPVNAKGCPCATRDGPSCVAHISYSWIL